MLGADIVLPPAVCRDSFEHYFHISKEKNEVKWSPIPTKKILDVAGIKAAWANLGIQVLEVGSLGGLVLSSVCEQAALWESAFCLR